MELLYLEMWPATQTHADIAAVLSRLAPMQLRCLVLYQTECPSLFQYLKPLDPVSVAELFADLEASILVSLSPCTQFITEFLLALPRLKNLRFVVSNPCAWDIPEGPAIASIEPAVLHSNSDEENASMEMKAILDGVRRHSNCRNMAVESYVLSGSGDEWSMYVDPRIAEQSDFRESPVIKEMGDFYYQLCMYSAGKTERNQKLATYSDLGY